MDLSLDNQVKKVTYRGDIDGLRAVAVLLVIIFHAGLSAFSSGYIGVDIFFTISGFLITGKITSEIKNKKFSFSEFISARLWRLQPALITTVMTSVIIASYCYIPDDYKVFTNSAKYTSLFLSNQFFDKQSATYASPDADSFLLLHTWSLAIEWQWYFFFALFASLTMILLKKDKFKITDNKLLCTWLILTLAGTGIMLFTALFTHKQHYYSLTMRAFEFLVGGGAALIKDRVPTLGKITSNIIAIAAISIIIWVASLKINVDFYPNTWTLVVCIATSVIFLTRNSFVNEILRLSPVNYTGKVSYSLYLWHWPVFAAFNYLGYTLTGSYLCVAIAITVGLAVACYHSIENRFRYVKMTFTKSVALLVVAPIVVLLVLHTAAEKYNGLPQRFNEEYNHSFTLLNDASVKAAKRKDCHGGDQILAECHFGDINGKKTALLIGDSNANHFWGFYDVIGKDTGVKMYSLTTSTCLALPGIYQYDWWKYKGVNYNKCHGNVEKYYNYIRNNHYNYVIIGEVWSQYAQGPHLITKNGDERSDSLSKKRYEIALRDAINIIVESGAKPIVMLTIAGMPVNYQTCINQHVIHRYPFDEKECDNQKPHSIEDAWTMNLMKRMKTEFPSLSIVDSKSIQCISGTCISSIDGVTVYRDEGHLTDYASYQFGEMYIKLIGNPLN